jgi:hypothetical protein
MDVTLREMRDDDLPVFYVQMNDPEGTRMAAFTAVRGRCTPALGW